MVHTHYMFRCHSGGVLFDVDHCCTPPTISHPSTDTDLRLDSNQLRRILDPRLYFPPQK